MPRVSTFHGIAINMYYNDHDPAHFHAIYGGVQASYTISPTGLLKGRLPSRQHQLVIEWASAHADELAGNWRKARSDESMDRISGLE